MKSKFDIGPLASGMRVGLFGGSFDPPHAGHVQFSREAVKRFALDRLIWLVSPGNPLKDRRPMSLEKRMIASRKLIRHPLVSVSRAESVMKTRFTADTLRNLKGAFPHVRFVWLMGADNMVQFHHWHEWKLIMHLMPIGILARPGHRLAARNSVAARSFRTARLPDTKSRLLTSGSAPRWCFADMPLRSENSTEMRRKSNVDHR